MNCTAEKPGGWALVGDVLPDAIVKFNNGFQKCDFVDIAQFYEVPEYAGQTLYEKEDEEEQEELVTVRPTCS